VKTVRLETIAATFIKFKPKILFAGNESEGMQQFEKLYDGFHSIFA
jgi:hypothetical protein